METPSELVVEPCAACGAPISRANAYLSGSGPVCEPCHRREAATARLHNLARESNTSALLGGIFAVLAGITLLATGLIFPAIPVKACLVAVTVIVTAVLRVPRMHTTARHGTLGKALVVVGALLGAAGVVAIGLRFLPG